MNKKTLSARAQIKFRSTAADAFNAFAEAESMSKFWFTRKDDGLVEGEKVTWFLGPQPDAFAFEILVKEVDFPHKLVMEWMNGDAMTQVAWSFVEADDGTTVVTIEESGYDGDEDAMLEKALDSTGGFNQVIVAAKALVDHGVALNVVADHA